LTRKELPAPATLLDAAAKRLPAGTTCASWEGNFTGTLTHLNGGRVQPASLRLTAFDADGPCALAGLARLDFAAGRTAERMTFTTSRPLQDPTSADVTLTTNGDAILQLRHDGDHGFTGLWFSKLYGLVGTVRLGTSAAQKPQGAPTVAGLAGHYLSRFHPDWSLDLATDDASARESYGSLDPFALRRVSGSTLWETEVGGHRIPFRDGVAGTSYDYFTNYLVMKVGALLSGSVTERELHLHGVSYKYLSIAAPLATERPYVRVDRPRQRVSP
jgi:hypothetical protein